MEHASDLSVSQLASFGHLTLDGRCRLRLHISFSARASYASVHQCMGHEETFFPRMIDADSKKADRASPLERFNLASTSNPMPELALLFFVGNMLRADACLNPVA